MYGILLYDIMLSCHKNGQLVVILLNVNPLTAILANVNQLSVIMTCVILLLVILPFQAYRHSSECPPYLTECHSTESHSPDFHCGKSYSAECYSTECHIDDCHFILYDYFFIGYDETF